MRTQARNDLRGSRPAMLVMWTPCRANNCKRVCRIALVEYHVEGVGARPECLATAQYAS